MCALVEAQQLQRCFPDAEDPARYEARVPGKEAILTAFVGADIAEPVPDDECAFVQDARVRSDTRERLANGRKCH